MAEALLQGQLLALALALALLLLLLQALELGLGQAEALERPEPLGDWEAAALLLGPGLSDCRAELLLLRQAEAEAELLPPGLPRVWA